jgi:hypothetical protein
MIFHGATIDLLVVGDIGDRATRVVLDVFEDRLAFLVIQNVLKATYNERGYLY